MAKKKTSSSQKTKSSHEKMNFKEDEAENRTAIIAATGVGGGVVGEGGKDRNYANNNNDKDDHGYNEEYEEDEDADEEEEEEEMVYLQVDTGDIVKLKQVLDEAVAGSVLQAQRIDGTPANDINLPENRSYDNFKLIIMTLACIFALIAQFSPIPFPESRVWVGLFCAMYFVFSGILQYTITFMDKDCIFVTKPVTTTNTSSSSRGGNKDHTTKKIHPLLTQYGLRFRSSLPRFSEFYSIIIEFHGLDKAEKKKSPFVKQTWSVGQFFDKDGMFDEYGLAEEVVKLYRRLECGNFDSIDGSNMKLKTS